MGVYTLKLLITVLTLTISLPTIVGMDYRSATLSLVVFFLSRIVGAIVEDDTLLPIIPVFRAIEQLTGVIGTGFCFYYLASFSQVPGLPKFFSDSGYAILLIILTGIYIAIDLTLFSISLYKKYNTYKNVQKFVIGRRRQ